MARDVMIKKEPGIEVDGEAKLSQTQNSTSNLSINRTILRDLKQRCSLQSVADENVNVAIIPHDKSPEDCVQEACIPIFTLPCDSTFSNVIGEYRQQYKSCKAVRLYRTNGVPPKNTTVKLSSLARDGILILRAVEHTIEPRALWDVFAMHEMVEQSSKIIDKMSPKSNTTADLAKIHRDVVQKWTTLTPESMRLIEFQAQYLALIHDNTSQHRAFWIFYQDFFNKLSSSPTHGSIRRAEQFFKAVFRRWNKLAQLDIRRKSNGVLQNEREFPIPNMPSRTVAYKEMTSQANSSSELIDLTSTITHDIDLPLEHLQQLSESAVGLLAEMEGLLRGNSDKYRPWLNAIQHLLRASDRKPTKIGVVGATGSGKSTIINALLGESDLLPTSSFEACTAVPVELKYNNESDDLYRLKVYFTSKTAWEQEVRLWLAAMEDPEALENEEVQIAGDKLSAVYPEFPKEDYRECTLLDVQEVVDKLDTNITLTGRTATELDTHLQRYIGSQEDPTIGALGESSRSFWPLVNSVELLVKSPLLESGIVLLDLPGVLDTNKARVAVARNHQVSCSQIFFVAPITRAVSDDQLRNSITQHVKFKLQSRAGPGQITVICSKADDIEASAKEAQNCGALPQFESLNKEEAELQRQLRALTNQLEQDRNQLREIGTKRKNLVDQLQQLGMRPKDSENGRLMSEINDESKATEANALLHKRRKLSLNGNSETITKQLHDPTRLETDLPHKIPKLNRSDPMAQEMGFMLQNDQPDDHTRVTSLRIITTEKSLQETSRLLAEIAPRKHRLCHTSRNTTVRRLLEKKINGVVQKIYDGNDCVSSQYKQTVSATGKQDIQVAKTRVFCVAAKAALSLGTSKLRSIEDTELPKLQEHCRDLDETAKILHYRRFLNEFGCTFDSLQLWANCDKIVTTLSAEEKEEKIARWGTNLKHHMENVGKVTQRLGDSLSASQKAIRKALEHGARIAGDCALSTAKKWAGEISWGKYRMVVKNHGFYAQKNGTVFNFNQDLSQPLMKALTDKWDELMAGEIRMAFESAFGEIEETIAKVKETSLALLAKINPGLRSQGLLAGQFEKRLVRIGNEFDDSISKVSLLMWDFESTISDCVQNFYKNVYDSATKETGKGSNVRRQIYLESAIEQAGTAPFTAARGKVRAKIEVTMTQVVKNIQLSIAKIFDEIEKDCLRTYHGQTEKLTEEEELVLKRVNDSLTDFRIRSAATGIDAFLQDRIVNETSGDVDDEEFHGKIEEDTLDGF